MGVVYENGLRFILQLRESRAPASYRYLKQAIRGAREDRNQEVLESSEHLELRGVRLHNQFDMRPTGAESLHISRLPGKIGVIVVRIDGNLPERVAQSVE